MNDVHVGAGFWKLFDTGITQWDTLQQAQSTEVLIIGGGMSGLLTAYVLHQNNIEFLLIEANDIAEGSSLASTGLLQYSNDIMLHELREQIGAEQADYFYTQCYKAVENLKKIASTLKMEVGEAQLYSRSSMQYCSDEIDADKLQKEYDALSSIGMPCELWNRKQISSLFPFSKPLGLITHGDAEVNPHLFVLRLAQYLKKQGCRLFERSEATESIKTQAGVFKTTVNGYSIDSQYVVNAVGYQFSQLDELNLKILLNRSYVIATQPLEDMSFWYQKIMLWETARPYLYARTTADSRIVIGGLDEATHHVNYSEASMQQHSQRLLDELKELFPNQQLDIAFQWNATFLETQDGLPYIGSHPHDPNQLYVLGYGGNGTVYSMLGAQWVADTVKGSQQLDKLHQIVGLSR